MISYLSLLSQLALLQADLRTLTSAPKALVNFINPGRLVRVLPGPFNADRPVPDFAQVGFALVCCCSGYLWLWF